MPDLDLRALERAVDQAPASDLAAVDARHALTRERLRRCTGILAFWPGPRAPHPSSARVSLEHETTHPTTGERKTIRCPGWALAVGGVSDFFDLGRIARSVTFLDLATKDWFRGSARRSGIDLAGGLAWREEATTLDAFGRPRATVRARPRSIDADRRDADVGETTGMVREESVYDVEWMPWGETRVTLFQNYHNFTHSGAPRQKQHMLDSNLSGVTGALPQGYTLNATGITVDLFGADGRPLPAALHDEACGNRFVQWVLTQNPLFTWPMGVVARTPLEADDMDPAAEPRAYVIERPAPPVFPLAFPLTLNALEQFGISVVDPTRWGGQEPRAAREGGFFVRVTLTGFLARMRFA